MTLYYRSAIILTALIAFIYSEAECKDTGQYESTGLTYILTTEHAGLLQAGGNNPVSIISPVNFFRPGHRQDQDVTGGAEYSRPKEESISIGIFADYGINYHNASFKELKGVPNCCSEFRNGSGNGAALGLLFDIPFSVKSSLTLRGGLFTFSGLLKAGTTESINIDDSLVYAETEHSIDASLYSMSIEPLFNYKIVKNLSILAGLNAGIVFKKSFYQKETLIQPSDRGAFENGLRVRNEIRGEIPDVSNVSLFFDFGLSYDFPLNKFDSYIISPEFMYSYGLNNITNSTPWTVNVLRFGLSIKYRPLPEYSSPLKP